MIIRLTLPLLSVWAVVALAACGESPPPTPAPTVAPTVVPTSTPVPTPSPTPIVPFKESLSSADVARFQALPPEVQDALVNESLENGNESALRFLRDMPDDPAALSEILDAEALSLLDAIDEPYRRELLLEGYPNSAVRYSWNRRAEKDPADLEYRYGLFDMLVRGVHQTLTEDGHLLPPLEENLSPAEFKKFESLDRLLQEYFRLVWETRRARSPSDESVVRMKEDLMNMPTELPGIQELGLSEAAVRILEQAPEMRDYAEGTVAGYLVLDQDWDSNATARLQRHIEAYEKPGGREALAKGLRPGESDPWDAILLCQPPAWGPQPPDGAVPKPYRGVHPAKLVYYWPEPEDALSDAALANFRLLDEKMLGAFEVRWFGHGLPHDARFMSCLVAEWDRGIANTPFTSMPGPDIFLPEDKRKFYDELTDHEKWAIELNLAADILKGEVWFRRSRFGEAETASTLDSLEEFLEGLRFSAVEWVCGFHGGSACQ